MNYWKVIFATAVIFGAGVFTGGLLVNMVHQTPGHSAAHHPAAAAPNSGTNSNANTNAVVVRLPEVLSKPFLPKLDDALHLSSEQHTNIEKIIVNAQAQTRKVMQDTRMQIRGELTPEQRAIYDQLMKRPGSVRRNGGTNALESLMWTNPPAGALPAATTNH